MENQGKDAGLWGPDQSITYPLIVKTGINSRGQTVRYYFNYSDSGQVLAYPYSPATELLSGNEIRQGDKLNLSPWGVCILLETSSKEG